MKENEPVMLPDNPSDLRAIADAPKTKAPNDYEVARKVIEGWGKPIAGKAGELWEFTKERGWQVVTEAVRRKLNGTRGRNAEGCAAIAYTQLAIPAIEHQERVCHYWEREGGIWDGKWVPFEAKAWQVLYTDYLHDLKSPDNDLDLSRRVIFGPRISLPYTEEVPDTTEIEAMVERQGWSPEVRAYFQRVIGRILQPHVHFRRIIIFWGTPHSGKSTLATAFGCAPNGLQGFSNASEATLVRDKWATLMLVNRFCNVSDDSAQVFGDRWVSFMKAYTSGLFSVEPKYMKPTTTVATAKLIATCNDPQELVDASGAAEMRVCAFEFTHQIERTGDIEQEQLMTAGHWSTPERRAGVLEWMTEGLRKSWTQGGRVNEPEEVKQTRRNINTKADPIMSTLRDALVEDPKGFLPTSDILSLFQNPQNRGGRPLSMSLPQYIGRLFPNAVQTRCTVKGAKIRGYTGLALEK